MLNDDLIALARLVLAGGPVLARRRLLERCGSPAAALAAGTDAWREDGLDGSQIARLRGGDADGALARTERWLQAPGHHLVGWHDADYPAPLRAMSSPPLALFVDGDPGLLWRPAVAIVGSRTPTSGGRDNAHYFARSLASAGIVVVSGMARGIDAVAHEAALAVGSGTTVAVVGTGPDVTYPPAHDRLRDRLAAQGAVVSEHPPGTPALRSHFPARNRILAGLTLGTLVVEAAEQSGALITARQAGEAGREVFAVPGSIHNPKARGCHRLIRDGAALVEEPREVVDALAHLAADLADALRARLGEAESGVIAGPGETPFRQDRDYQCLWEALGHDPTGMDQLVSRTGLTAAELSSMLLVMELDGLVTAEHGRYQRKTGFFTSTASMTQAEGQ
ncbi:DNA-processing protein DprA [Pseudoxanthomonas sp. PXM02]|uniref:DNA-processing protein DprA n=1 Tax=Pseudoxanthomonas sp. PXM02 TaxID=2769294 RepID=UPI00177B0039|nr:DNA-processing protein DprA [Pseudoxanthomonas sp. PXM02]MBD9480218.1 DNA-protecting protein DprA [Pseudoxanthomonas sp. PXM02]